MNIKETTTLERYLRFLSKVEFLQYQSHQIDLQGRIEPPKALRF